MLSVASVTCFFHGLFSISDYGCCTRAAGKCGKMDHQPENLPITSARQAFSPFRFRGQARSGARISVKKRVIAATKSVVAGTVDMCGAASLADYFHRTPLTLPALAFLNTKGKPGCGIYGWR